MTSKSDEIKALKNKRGTIKARLTRFVTFFEKAENKADVNNIKARLRGIDSCFSEFEDVHSQIELLDPTQATEQELAEFENDYYKVITDANALIANAQIVTQNNSVSTSLSQSSNDTEVGKLPDIPLPQFTGLFTEWITFRDTFQSLIHNNAKLNNIQKFHYLKGAVKDIALEAIENISLSDSNYTAAWDILTSQFENVRLITQHHIRAIFALPSINRDAKTVRKFIFGLTSNLKALESIQRPVEHWDDLLVYLITTKFDSLTTVAWENTLTTTPSTLQDLITFLKQRCRTLESLEINNSYNKSASNMNTHGNNKYHKNSHNIASSHVSSNHSNQQANTCIICKQQHKLYQCKTFLDLSVNQRISQVKKHNLCQNCLRTGHSTEKCVAGNCKTCHKKHNSLIHPENIEPHQTEITVSNVCDNYIHSKVLLPTALIHILDKNNKPQLCRALLDSGSQSNFITTKLCKKLGLELKSIDMSVTGISASTSNIRYKTNITIKSRINSYSSNLECLALNQITSNTPFTQLHVSNTEIPKEITLADPNFNISSEIDILLGAELFWSLLLPTKIETSPNLHFQNTQFGFIACGRLGNSRNKNNTSCNLSIDGLNKQLSQFWKLESFDHKRSLSADEQLCEEHFKLHTVRQLSGRFIVKLPFRRYPPDLGSSRQTAIKRFLSLENKFKRNEVLERDYRKFINEYESLGHLEHIPAVEASKINPTESYYLAHHAVFKDSSTTHLRVVFDGSCQSSNNKSLNDNLFPGPALQQELFCILIRFRIHRFVISADIAKMYRQILVHPEHQNYQLILWRDQPHKPIETYKLNTVTYGLASSPYLAIKCLHELAKSNTERFPDTFQIILNDFYVDDMLTGADSIEKALKIRKEVTTMLSEGGFELRKFASNDPQLLPPSNESLASNQSISLDMQSTNKTLGVIWDFQADSIKYSVSSNHLTNKISKRNILSVISRLFDPLGLVSPITVVAKIILQKIWSLKIDWDEKLPLQLQSNWEEFSKTFTELNQLSIPRKVISDQTYTRVEIHGFSDSSQKSYGACVYLRTIDIDGHATSNLLCAKNKVAPLQTLTIPRLELSAAVLLVKLVDKIKHNLNITVDQCFYWTDSTIVLCWIKMQSNSLKTFVANRVSQIQSLSKPKEWRHINTAENPADILTRGTTPNQLINNKVWWHGPEFLLNKETHFVDEDSTSQVPLQLSDLPEIKQTCCVSTANDHNNDFDLLTKLSSFSKTLRVTAYIMRFINNIQTSKDKKSGHLSVTEIKDAHDIIIKLTQKQIFFNDIHHLKKHGEILKSSKLSSLNPFLDKNDLLRVGGRLEYASISNDQKHQLILPKNHHITQLLINECHLQQLHAGCQAVIAILRQKYWIISCRSVVRQIIFKCVKCFKVKPISLNQLMGNLPKQRITPSRPFTNTAIDYAGPITIKNGHGRTNKTLKCYIAIFVCFSTKAVHLELVCDCTSLTFLNALKRFMARRGKVSLLYSDNATNFVGANRELAKLFKSTDFQNKVVNSLSNEQIKWQFIPPKSPHMNGLSEAAVKSVKTHLKRILNNTLLNYEEFYTLLTMVEACLNSRPITPLSNDPSDLSALTPGHFLIGDVLTAPVQPNFVDIQLNRLSRYQLLEKLKQHFWTRWSREYLHNLQQRGKWTKIKQPPPVGKLVLLHEDNVPPQSWVLGRIQACHPGPDGLTRSVTVKTVRGVLKRAITKVCPLPCD